MFPVLDGVRLTIVKLPRAANAAQTRFSHCAGYVFKFEAR